MSPRAGQAGRPTVTVTRVDADDERTIAFVVAAGSDPDGYHNTYLPEGADRAQARAWLARVSPHVYRIDVGGATVGVIAAHAAISGGVPAGTLETGSYLIAPARGQRIAGAAWRQVEPELARVCDGLCGVVWETNTAARRRLAREGYTQIGRVVYSDDTSEGWCAIYLKAFTRRN